MARSLTDLSMIAQRSPKDRSMIVQRSQWSFNGLSVMSTVAKVSWKFWLDSKHTLNDRWGMRSHNELSTLSQWMLTNLPVTNIATPKEQLADRDLWAFKGGDCWEIARRLKNVQLSPWSANELSTICPSLSAVSVDCLVISLGIRSLSDCS